MFKNNQTNKLKNPKVTFLLHMDFFCIIMFSLATGISKMSVLLNKCHANGLIPQIKSTLTFLLKLYYL